MADSTLNAKKQGKRDLTHDEIEAASKLAAAIKASTKTQEEIGADAGVSQGMIWQWANARLPVPIHRASDLARAVGVQPETISVEYRELVNRVMEERAVYNPLSPEQAVVLSILADLSPEAKKAWEAVGSALAKQAHLKPQKNGSNGEN